MVSVELRTLCLIAASTTSFASFFNTGVDPAFHPSCVIRVLTPRIDGLIHTGWNRTRPLISAIDAVSSIQVSTFYLSGVLSDSCIYYVWVEILRPDTLVTAALWYRAGHYIFVLWFLQSFFVLSSPILSRCILDVYHTSTHDVNLAKI